MARMLTYEEALAQELLMRRQPVSTRLLTTLTGRPAVGVQKPPWIDLPPGGEAFVRTNAAAVVCPAIGAEVVVATFRVPQGKHGAIRYIANQFIGAGWVEGDGNLLWRVQADGIPFSGYDALLFSLGTPANPGDLGQDPLRIYENQLIELVCRNVAVVVAAQPLLGLFRGKFYPIEQEWENYWL